MAAGLVEFVIDPASREQLLKAFPPKYSEVKLTSVRHKAAATEVDLPKCSGTGAKVVGYHHSDGLEVLTFEINQSCHQNTGGKGERFLYSVLSCDPKKMHPRKPEDMISGIALKGGEKALYNLPQSIAVTVTPKFTSLEMQVRTPVAKAPEKPKGPSIVEQATQTVGNAADAVRGALTRGFRLFR
jgi:hypothetical protein